MPLATLRQVLDEAVRRGYGVPGIVGAAGKDASPAIVQVSGGTLGYAGENYLWHVASEVEAAIGELEIGRASCRERV